MDCNFWRKFQINWVVHQMVSQKAKKNQKTILNFHKWVRFFLHLFYCQLIGWKKMWESGVYFWWNHAVNVLQTFLKNAKKSILMVFQYTKSWRKLSLIGITLLDSRFDPYFLYFDHTELRPERCFIIMDCNFWRKFRLLILPLSFSLTSTILGAGGFIPIIGWMFVLPKQTKHVKNRL